MYGRQQVVDCLKHGDIHVVEYSDVHGDALAKFPKLARRTTVLMSQHVRRHEGASAVAIPQGCRHSTLRGHGP